MTTQKKVEFGGPDWMKEIQRLFAELAVKVDNPDLDLTLCEVFTGVPKHLDKTGTGKIAWYCRMRGTKVDFHEGEPASTNRKVVGDYAFFLPFARAHIDDSNEAELNVLLAQGVRDGIVQVSGEQMDLPPHLRFFVHNELTKITA